MNDSKIYIKNKAVKTIESAGRNYFMLEQKSGMIPFYCEAALVDEVCPCLLPMRFTEQDDGVSAYYDYSGHIQMRNIFKLWKNEKSNVAVESIKMLSSIIRCALSIENYLFISEGYRLNEDSVFINHESRELKLAYIPEEIHGNEERSFFEKLAAIILSMADMAEDDQWSIYAEGIAKNVLYSVDSPAIIERKLHLIGREIFLKGWPEPEELRTGGQ
ncbi:hypothetical protein MASR2M70_02670 [Bacillota bacterium]